MSTSSADSTPGLSDECGPHCGTITVGAAHRLTKHCPHCHTQETTQEEVFEDGPDDTDAEDVQHS